MSASITKQKLLAGLITAALATGAIGSAVYAGSFFGFGGEGEQPEEVQLAMVQKKDLENTINVTGALASASEKAASVNAKDADLIVKEIKVKVGDTVKAGDVLFTLDTEDLEISLAQAERKLAILERKNELAERQEKRDTHQLEFSNDIAETQEVRDIWLAEDHLDDNYVDLGLTLDELYKKYGVEDQSYLDAVNAQIEMYNAEDALNAALADPAMTTAQLNDLKGIYNTAVEKFNTAVTSYETAIGSSITAEAATRSANRTVRDKEKEIIDKRETLEKSNLERENNEKKSRDTMESNSLDRSVSDYELTNELKKLREQISASVITAPSSGVVTAVNAKVGAAAGTDPVVVTDTNNFIVACDVDEQFIADIKEGMTARFTTNATGDETLPGKVTFTALTPTKQQSSSNNGDGSNNNTSTSGSTDKSRGNYRVLIKADNYNERLRTGMSSKITIVTAEAKGVLAVPNECLSNDNDGNTILKVTTDGGATSQEVVVTTGLSDGSFTEVSGDGITEGTQLVIPQMAEVSEEMPELF